VPITAKSVAYVKFAQKASGFAIAGVAAVVDKKTRTTIIGITGVEAKPYRASAVENQLRGKELSAEVIRAASSKASEGIDALNDIHASAEFRAHLAQVYCQRAVTAAASR